MEQKGGAGHRPGAEASAQVHNAVAGVHHRRSCRVGAHPEGAGVLLREHELHEGVPQDHLVVLQRYYLIFLFCFYKMLSNVFAYF